MQKGYRMARAPSLRQIEAFKAIVETGTVSRAAQVLRISQPAASKLIVHLEADAGMELFDREGGRLKPNARGMRLYEEVDRIFAGLQQIERTFESIRREELEHISIGVMPALSGSFIAEVVRRFRQKHSNVNISIYNSASSRLVEWLAIRQLDFGIATNMLPNPHLHNETLINENLVCILPLNHKLNKLEVIKGADLISESFISFDRAGYLGHVIDDIFKSIGSKPKNSLASDAAADICALVGEGLGVALIHPLLASSAKGRIVVRPFVPSTPIELRMGWPKFGRNKKLVEAFALEARATAIEATKRLLCEP
jgi:DNA-binding transcriptional LysR family regulator